MTQPLTSHAHYYTAAGRACRHLVTYGERAKERRYAIALCGREVPARDVRASDGHRHVTDWVEELEDGLCADCVRRATRPLDRWDEPDLDLALKERKLRGQA